MILSLKSELPASVKGAPELFSVSDSPQDFPLFRPRLSYPIWLPSFCH